MRPGRPPQDDPVFANLTYGLTADGVLLEDVASQQKSFIAVLVGVAIDRGLLDVDAPTFIAHFVESLVPDRQLVAP